jgi:hypothetical protein
VIPFADAVRLVNRDEAQVPAFQVVNETGEHKTLRRGVMSVSPLPDASAGSWKTAISLRPWAVARRCRDSRGHCG